MLTRGEIEKAKPRPAQYRLTDGGGLVLNVLPTGRKVWRYRYLRDGKDAVVTLGNYPEITLLDAREKALTLRKGRQDGVDPVVARKRQIERTRTVKGETFAEVAEALMQRESGHWSEGHFSRFRNRMVRDVIPVIGDLRARDIAPADVTRSVAGIESRGAQNTAIRTVGMIGQVLQYAVARGLADQDVTLHMRRGLDRAPRPVHRAAVLDRADLGQMLSDL
jgi:hypothetical protein